MCWNLIFLVFFVSVISSHFVQVHSPVLTPTPKNLIEVVDKQTQSSEYFLFGNSGSVWKAGNEIFDNINNFKLVEPNIQKVFWSKKICYNHDSKFFLSLATDIGPVSFSRLETPNQWQTLFENCQRNGGSEQLVCDDGFVVSFCEFWNGQSTARNITVGFGTQTNKFEWTKISNSFLTPNSRVKNVFATNGLIFVDVAQSSPQKSILYYAKPSHNQKDLQWKEAPSFFYYAIAGDDNLLSIKYVNGLYFVTYGNRTHATLRVTKEDFLTHVFLVKRYLRFSGSYYAFVEPQYKFGRYYFPHSRYIYSFKSFESLVQGSLTTAFTREFEGEVTARSFVLSSKAEKTVFLAYNSIYSGSSSSGIAFNNSGTSEIHDIFLVGDKLHLLVGSRIPTYRNHDTSHNLLTTTNFKDFSVVPGKEFKIPFCELHRKIRYSQFLGVYFTSSFHCSGNKEADIFISKDGRHWTSVGISGKVGFRYDWISQVTAISNGFIVVVGTKTAGGYIIFDTVLFTTNFASYHKISNINSTKKEFSKTDDIQRDFYHIEHFTQSSNPNGVLVALRNNQQAVKVSVDNMKTWTQVKCGCSNSEIQSQSVTTKTKYYIFNQYRDSICVASALHSQFSQEWESKTFSLQSTGIISSIISFQVIHVAEKDLFYFLFRTAAIAEPSIVPHVVCYTPDFNSWNCERPPSLVDQMVQVNSTTIILYGSSQNGAGQLATIKIA